MPHPIVTQYGIDFAGNNPSGAQLQQYLDDCEDFASGREWGVKALAELPPASVVKVEESIKLNQFAYRFNGNGSVFVAQPVTRPVGVPLPPLLRVMSSDIGPTKGFQVASGIYNLQIAEFNGAGRTAIQFEDDGGAVRVGPCHTPIVNVQVHSGWDYAIDSASSNTYLQKIQDCNLAGLKRAVRIRGAANTGENIKIFGTVMTSPEWAFELDDPNGNVHIHDMSTDFMGSSILVKRGRCLVTSAGHIEFDRLTRRLVEVSGPGSQLTLRGVRFLGHLDTDEVHDVDELLWAHSGGTILVEDYDMHSCRTRSGETSRGPVIWRGGRAMPHPTYNNVITGRDQSLIDTTLQKWPSGLHVTKGFEHGTMQIIDGKLHITKHSGQGAPFAIAFAAPAEPQSHVTWSVKARSATEMKWVRFIRRQADALMNPGWFKDDNPAEVTIPASAADAQPQTISSFGFCGNYRTDPKASAAALVIDLSASAAGTLIVTDPGLYAW